VTRNESIWAEGIDSSRQEMGNSMAGGR